MTKLSLLCLAAAMLGCTQGNSVSSLMTVADSAAMVRTDRRLTTIMLSDFVDTCAIADERNHPDSKLLEFLVADMDVPPEIPGNEPGGPPSRPGVFEIYTFETLPYTGLVGLCTFMTADHECRLDVTRCTSGSVTLTRVDAAGYAGTFDVVIDDAHVTGSFDAPACDNVSEAGFGTCE